MLHHKLLILVMVYAGSTANQPPEFRPIDDRVEPILNKYLHRSDGVESMLRDFIESCDNCNLTRGIEVRRVGEADIDDSREESIADSIIRYARHHVIRVHFADLIENASAKVKRNALESSGRSFGLQKLMTPIMIGAQIVKSVLLAMFLPSIMSGLGQLVGKSVSTFATASNGFGQHNAAPMEEFEFKDTDNLQYPDAQADGSSSLFSYSYPNQYDYGRLQQQTSIGVLPGHAQSLSNRYTPSSQKVSYLPNSHHHGSFYTKHHKKQQSYKIFHNIPSSSLLLTNYDPFYSPLLSRMDSVFKQLGYETETCRERLICLMYKSPAKFAPYSNLISAQLSRELNELRKPSTDNPDILRFFKYMKAAKDGQDGADCMRMYAGCLDSRETINPPMVKTYNEINKLVHARKMHK